MKAPGATSKPSSFGADGRRVGGGLIVHKKKLLHVPNLRTGARGGGGGMAAGTPANTGRSSSSLFSPRSIITVHRAPMLCGLSVSSSSSLQKKFQRPMTKRRSYDKSAESALKTSSLGQRRRMDGMSKLMARAGRGLSYKLPNQPSGRCGGSEGESGSDGEEEEEEKDMPFEPLRVWHSPHEGGEAKGLPPAIVTEMQPDEYGVEEAVQVERPAPASAYAKQSAYVPPILCKWLRPHQREGVEFLYECTMSLRSFDGSGCILADDMGLGKTLQSITLLYTLLKTSITADNAPTVKRAIIVCPCSLVKNWDNEIIKWIANGGPGPGKGVTPPRVMALAEQDRATVEKNIDAFCKTSLYPILIVSYETLRAHVGRLTKHRESKCDLLIADEAHRLKNRDNMTTRALNTLPCRRRVLLTGTPMQNDLEEFYAMVDFTNPGILGTPEEFRKNYLFPVLRGREPDATDRQKAKMMECQRQLSELVNEFILRRVNTLNAQHLPPKLVQVVCCNLTDVQRNMYEYLIAKMEQDNVMEGKQSNALGWIQLLMKLSNHPQLVADEDPSNDAGGGGGRRRGKGGKVSYNDNEGAMTESLNGVSKFLPQEGGYGGGGSFGRRNVNHAPVRPEFSGKMFVLWRLMTEMRKPYCRDKIVIVSNYTQTLDLIGRMCSENGWGFCRLDGSIGMKKRQKMVDDFNDPNSHLIAFLLSSKAGGCGLNLIGGNRLVLFDPDWNPAVDKQAAARCWRDGQKKRCFTYRFLATGTVEEKIFQRQLSKEGLQSVVDDKEQVNAISSRDLRNLFKLRTNTPSDTHDKLNCQRCKIIHENSEQEARAVLPLQLKVCRDLLDKLCKHDDAAPFVQPLKPEEHDKTREEYEKLVKQPMDVSVIRKKLAATLSSLSSSSAVKSSATSSANTSYTSVSHFSRDVNRIWSNVLKVWTPGQHDIASAAHRLQSWWVDEWSELVPKLMQIKAAQKNGAQGSSDDKENVENASANDDSNENQCSERSEDFQEQIGMPDEEDMRSWSHHFSTETCDDPVLRAAMKGFDSISFSFGLEVTWSLIQQRQQEEEERAAMEELHRLEQIEEEETEDQEEGQEGNTCEGVETVNDTQNTPADVSEAPSAENDDGDSSDDEEWILSRIFAQEEIESSSPAQCASDGCELHACTVWKSSLGKEWMSCLDCLEDFGGWPSGLEPVDKPDLMACIRSRCSAKGGDSASKGGKGKDGAPQDPPMEENGSARADKPLDENHHNTPSTEQDGEYEPSGWTCPKCTYSNTPKKRKCDMCQCKKPAGAKQGRKRHIDEVE